MTVFENQTMRVDCLVAGAFENNIYIVSDIATGSAVIIDAAAEAERIISAVQGLHIFAVLTTHGHHDHVGAIPEVPRALGVPWRLHPADVGIAGLTPDEPLIDGSEITIGDLTLSVIHTPGHTPGSVSFALGPIIFTGDTLFPGGPGATRWDYSDFDQIMESLETKLFVFDDETTIFPGHGSSTTLGAERPHIPEWRERGW